MVYSCRVHVGQTCRRQASGWLGFIYKIATYGLVWGWAGIGFVGCGSETWVNPQHMLYTQVGLLDPSLERLPEIPGDTAPAVSGRLAKIVQFVGPIQPAWKHLLQARGAHIEGYMPEHALWVVAPPETLAWIQHLPMVRALVDSPRVLRLGSSLWTQSQDGPQLVASGTALDMVVEWAEGFDREDMLELIHRLGGHIRQDSHRLGDRMWAIRIDTQGAAILASHPDVLAIEQDRPVHLLNDVSYGMIQSGALHKSPLWQAGLHGEGQIVGICDVGVAVNTCFFGEDKIVQYENITPFVPHDVGHGTHTAGSIAGDQAHNGLYDVGDGMAPAARLCVQDAGTPTVGQVLLPMDLTSLFDSAYRSGARIHSNSWGDDSNAYGLRERSLDGFVAAHPDFLVVAANGNAGDQIGGVGSPATAKNVVAVGALNGASIDDVAVFSSHGPAADGRIKPILVAPGVQVASASGNVPCGTEVKSGTSMAAPILAGGAALVRQYFTDGYYPTGVPDPSHRLQPSAALLKAVLLVGADNMQGDHTEGPRPTDGQGFGRLHLENSLFLAAYAARGPRRLWMADVQGQEGLEQAHTWSHTLQIKRRSDMRVALTWTDVPAAPGTSRALVNNLDLEVQTPEGTYLGNVFSQGHSMMGGTADAINVEEMVDVPHAPAGSYTILVHATNVPMGPQSFAVAVTGGFNGTLASFMASDIPEHGLVSSETSEHPSGCASTPAAGQALWVVGIGGIGIRMRRARLGSPTRRHIPILS